VLRHQQVLGMLLLQCWMPQLDQEMLLALGMQGLWHCQ
jgi:hypothetical protein